ncbi:MAG: HU family DNA-binding protein [Dysgonamonadaceae bacterium]|jgi:nucleoid DNA-binding protein|nr:HU family DNA-binding protein [Dysgonamonadaceae bacterium]
MNSTEFTTALAKKLELSRLEAGIRLDNLLSVITEELVNGHVISIANFGNLEVRKRKERVSIHPVTGKKMLLPPKMVVKFKPSASFNKKIKDLNYE